MIEPFCSATDTLLEKVRVGMLREAAVADAASGAVGTTTEPAATSSSGVELPLLRLGRESRVALSCRGLTTDAWLRSRTSGGTTSQSKSNGCALKSFERFVLSKKLVQTILFILLCAALCTQFLIALLCR